MTVGTSEIYLILGRNLPFLQMNLFLKLSVRNFPVPEISQFHAQYPLASLPIVSTSYLVSIYSHICLQTQVEKSEHWHFLVFFYSPSRLLGSYSSLSLALLNSKFPPFLFTNTMILSFFPCLNFPQVLHPVLFFRCCTVLPTAAITSYVVTILYKASGNGYILILK